MSWVQRVRETWRPVVSAVVSLAITVAMLLLSSGGRNEYLNRIFIGNVIALSVVSLLLIGAQLGGERSRGTMGWLFVILGSISIGVSQVAGVNSLGTVSPIIPIMAYAGLVSPFIFVGALAGFGAKALLFRDAESKASSLKVLYSVPERWRTCANTFIACLLTLMMIAVQFGFPQPEEHSFVSGYFRIVGSVYLAFTAFAVFSGALQPERNRRQLLIFVLSSTVALLIGGEVYRSANLHFRYLTVGYVEVIFFFWSSLVGGLVGFGRPLRESAVQTTGTNGAEHPQSLGPVQ